LERPQATPRPVRDRTLSEVLAKLQIPEISRQAVERHKQEQLDAQLRIGGPLAMQMRQDPQQANRIERSCVRRERILLSVFLAAMLTCTMLIDGNTPATAGIGLAVLALGAASGLMFIRSHSVRAAIAASRSAWTIRYEPFFMPDDGRALAESIKLEAPDAVIRKHELLPDPVFEAVRIRQNDSIDSAFFYAYDVVDGRAVELIEHEGVLQFSPVESPITIRR
jgi:hypothetical protein